MENDIAKKALQRIVEGGITPESKTVANLRKFGFWLPVILALVFGSLASAGMFFVLMNGDWDLLGRFGAGFIVRSMPYFWLFFLVVFVLLGEFSYAKTTIGYRYGPVKVIITYVLSTMLLGGVFLSLGGGALFERAMSVRGIMRDIMFNQTEVWSHPDQGLLSGTIKDIGTSTLRLVDFSGVEWSVDTQHALIRGRVQLENGEAVKLLGTMTASGFAASEIRPWVGNGSMRGNGLRNGSGAGVGRLGGMR